MTRLLERADVCVQNLAPGAADRLGVGPAELRSRRREVVTCSISGYGDTGPMPQRKAYDALLQAQTGLISITGSPGRPAKVGISIADIAAGMYAFSGILAALYRRGRTGEGATLQGSLLDALGEWVQQPALWRAYGGSEPVLSGAHHASIAPYGPYPTSDGPPAFIAIQNEREWAEFCRVVLGDTSTATDERFRDNPRRVAHREQLNEVLTRAFTAVPRAVLIERLDSAGTAYSELSTVVTSSTTRQTVGPRATPWTCCVRRSRRWSSPHTSVMSQALREHTDAVIKELGLDQRGGA